MDEEYRDSVDTSADVDVSDDISVDITDDIPEDDYSDVNMANDVSEDTSEEIVADDVEYEEADESIEEDFLEPETDELDESMDDLEEDTFEESDETSEDHEELDDIPEDTDGFDEELENKVDDTEEIPEDTDDTGVTDQEEAFDEDIPEDVTNTEATEGAFDVEDADTTEQSENQNGLETYDYETSPETQDAINPETSGEFTSADNPYREKWEQFAEEFSDEGKESDGWDSLKDVPFNGETKLDTDGETDDTGLADATSLSEQSDVEKASGTTEINSISDYMNAHNYGSDDFAIYSKDPQWRQLVRQEYPDYELPPLAGGKETDGSANLGDDEVLDAQQAMQAESDDTDIENVKDNALEYKDAIEENIEEDVDGFSDTTGVQEKVDENDKILENIDDFPYLSEDERRELEEETDWSKDIVDRIDTSEQADIYKNAELSEDEINDRKCLIKDIDLDYTDPKTGKTNRELMALGRPPFDNMTGERIELHHMGQEYDSPFAELCENSEHGDGNDTILHDKNIESWRQDDKLKNRYNNVDRPKHWTERLKKIESEV